MDLRRFLDLYIAEAQEQQRLLQSSLLRLEREGGGAAVDEAFRAAHTLKGLASAMGYSEVADLAHGLEDQLDQVRRSGLPPAPVLMDDLLAQADAIEAASEAAVRTPPVTAAEPGPVAAEPTESLAEVASDAPDGAVLVARVRLQPDAPIKAARAMLVLRALESVGGVLGSDPATFGDEFDGTFRIFFSADVDRDRAEAAIHTAGDVAGVEFGTPAATSGQRPGDTAARVIRQVRVDADRLDRVAEAIAELSLLQAQQPRRTVSRSGIDDVGSRMTAVLSELQHDVQALRMVPLRHAFERLPRIVRDAARIAGRQVELVITGDDVELDRTILDEIGEPLVHLLRNAVDHGIEAPERRVDAGKPAVGRIAVHAERERSSVRVTVADDGAGIDAERLARRGREVGLLPADGHVLTDEDMLRLLAQPGFSTAERVSTLSGRGVGLDAVVSRIRGLGGALDMRTRAGRGTTFTLRLPLSLSLAQALHVRVGGEDYAIPLTHLAEAVELDGNVVAAADGEVLRHRSRRLPLVRMRRILHVPAEGEERTAVVAELGERRAALAFDELIGREQILIRSIDPVLGMLPFFSGAALLADGRPALVLDPLSVI